MAAAMPSAAASRGGASEQLRCRVGSDVEELQLLHEVYGWVPGRDHVRPRQEVRAQKELLLINLESMWVSASDWVFHHVFGAATKRGPDGKRSASRPQPGSTVFKPNPYPYDVPSGTEHWVYWMASPMSEWPEERINAGLAREIDALGGGGFGARQRARTRCARLPLLAHAINTRVCVHAWQFGIPTQR